jgi:hypothetical protein
MTLGPNARYAILWFVIAILSYFCLELTLGWKPLGFAIGELGFSISGLTFPLSNIVFLILVLAAAVGGCFVLWADRHSN